MFSNFNSKHNCLIDVTYSSKCLRLTHLVFWATQEVGTLITIIFICGKLDYSLSNILVSLPAVLLPAADLSISILLD